MAERLRFTEFVDFVLARLYELDTGTPEFLDVNEIAAELRRPVPRSWPSDAVKVLQDRGLVAAVRAMQGTAVALINGEGRLFVEEQERTRSSTIHEYKAHPANFVFVGGAGNQVVVGSEGVSQTTKPNDDA